MSEETLSPEVAADLDKLLTEFIVPPLGPDEFTVRLVAERMDATYDRAERIILKMVRDGTAEFAGIRKRGRNSARAWRMVKKRCKV